MASASGYNPLRWDCEKSGCYNHTLRPRIEEFAPCFPGKIGMSDVDGVVEIGGAFLFIEWKSAGGAVTGGQRIMFEQLTALSPLITVVVVSGHPREMTVQSIQIFRNGVGGLPEAHTFEQLKARIARWAANARLRRSGHTRGKAA